MEFREDGYLHDYAPGEHERSSSYMGWHVSRSRLVVTGGKPSRANSLGGRIKDSVEAVGNRLELYYVARYSVQFHESGRVTLVPHSGDAGDKAVTFIRVEDAPRD